MFLFLFIIFTIVIFFIFGKAYLYKPRTTRTQEFSDL